MRIAPSRIKLSDPNSVGLRRGLLLLANRTAARTQHACGLHELGNNAGLQQCSARPKQRTARRAYPAAAPSACSTSSCARPWMGADDDLSFCTGAAEVGKEGTQVHVNSRRRAAQGM